MILELLFDSKVNLSSGLSSLDSRVKESSLLAHFKILHKFSTLTPRVLGFSHLKSVNPRYSSFRRTKATWEESMAWIHIPSGLMSMLTSLTIYLIDSTSFLKVSLSSKTALNICFCLVYYYSGLICTTFITNIWRLLNSLHQYEIHEYNQII